MSKLRRETRETQVLCEVRRGTGEADVKIADRFLSHMVETLARYASLDVSVEAVGDLRHHLVEDVAITLGLALKDEVPEKAARYGWAQIPMDEALAEAAVDLGGRPWYVGRLPSKLYTHFLHSFATNLGRHAARAGAARRRPPPPRGGGGEGRGPRPAPGHGRGGSGVQHQGVREAGADRLMLRPRVIVCLDVKDGRVVKGVRFEGLRDVGDPVELAARYEAEGADEIVYLDVSASREGRGTLLGHRAPHGRDALHPAHGGRRRPFGGRHRAAPAGRSRQGEREHGGGA